MRDISHIRFGILFSLTLLFSVLILNSCVPQKLQSLEPGVWISIEGGYDADFSPDGEYLVFTESVKGMNWKEDLILYSIQSGERTRLNQNSFWDGEARWQPGGENIVYTMDTVGLKNLFLYSVDNDSSEELTKAEAYHPTWSPSGKQLVFVSSRSRYPELWLFDIETQVFRQLTNFKKEVATPAWSPDNSCIVFCLSTDGQWDLWQLTLQDGKAKPLFETVQNECYPRWSKSGRFLAFCSFLPDAKKMFDRARSGSLLARVILFRLVFTRSSKPKNRATNFFIPHFLQMSSGWSFQRISHHIAGI